MGIVVTIFMMLILLMSVPNPIRKSLNRHRGDLFLTAFLIGGWNTFWYGAQHTQEFWGIAALISGVTMMITSLPNIPLKNAPAFIKNTLGWVQSKISLLPQGFNGLMLLTLFGCTCIYSYTLIQLSLS